MRGAWARNHSTYPRGWSNQRIGIPVQRAWPWHVRQRLANLYSWPHKTRPIPRWQTMLPRAKRPYSGLHPHLHNMARRLQSSLTSTSAPLIGLPPPYHHPKFCDQPAAALLVLNPRRHRPGVFLKMGAPQSEVAGGLRPCLSLELPHGLNDDRCFVADDKADVAERVFGLANRCEQIK
ncbi:hypothetical protein F5Y12DRAFT_448277 [Xylaria sp. FL1777]|nr:hypothetical protein F5Y12DRAFT_448277 [Xylaria sp. FL1777]